VPVGVTVPELAVTLTATVYAVLTADGSGSSKVIAVVVFIFPPPTVTVFEQELFPSLLSVTFPPESTAHEPPERGFTSEPATVGVTGTVTVIVPPTGIITCCKKIPVAHVKLFELIEQFTVPLVPAPSTSTGVPYDAPELGKLSDKIVVPERIPPVKVALALPLFVMVSTQLNGEPTDALSLTLFVFVTTKSGAVFTVCAVVLELVLNVLSPL
jgi:hypothetical protein